MGILDTLKNISTKAVSPARRLYQLPHGQVKAPVWKDWNTEQAIKSGLKASVWVYACISRKAAAISSVPLYVERRTAQNEWEREEGHELEVLLDQPNPYMSGQQMRELWAYYMDLGGNGLFHKVMLRNQPAELWLLRPDYVTPVPSERAGVSHYEYYLGGGMVKVPAEDVIHMMLPDPSNPYWGMSPLQAAAKVVDTDVEAVNWNKVSLQNRAVVDGILSTAEYLTDDQINDARKHIREALLADGVNGRNMLVTSGGLSWQQMGLSPVEMDFMNSREFNLREIHTVFGVDPLLTGAQVDSSGRANKQEAKRDFWEETIIPALDRFVEGLNRDLIRYWDPASEQIGTMPSLRIAYDLANVPALAENFDEKVTTARTLWSMGVPLNMINQRLELGFEDIPGGDVGRTQAPSLFTNAPAHGQKKHQCKSLSRTRVQWENRMASEIEDVFEEEKRMVTRAVLTGDTRHVEDVLRMNARTWQDTLAAFYRAAAPTFSNEWERDYLKNMPRPHTKQLSDGITALMERWITTQATKRSRLLLDSTWNDINDILIANQAAGQPLTTAAELITEKYNAWLGADDHIEMSRAHTIARTEMGAAYGEAQQQTAHMAMDEYGFIVEKEWSTAGEERVRPSHEEIDGERRGIDEYYSNGLMYPGDPNGPPEEVINCRCAEMHHIIHAEGGEF